MAPVKRVKKVMTLPINVIFQHLQKKTRVRIWIYEDVHVQMEGVIIGFDEYMNIVLDDAVEIISSSSSNQQNQNSATKRIQVGRCLLKGDAITLIQNAQPGQRPTTDE